MAYRAEIVLDSIAPNGARLTTWELEYPRFVHSELMTHRLFSRSSASSRAIPTAKLIQRVVDDPVMPRWWGKNQGGMQAREELRGLQLQAAQASWLAARDEAVRVAKELNIIGLHKQIANRVIEPWMFITVLVTATEFVNWFSLRDEDGAQPELRWVAAEMLKVYREAVPNPLAEGEWHMPFTDDCDTIDASLDLRDVSVGRCAAISYLNHEDHRDPRGDADRTAKMQVAGHMAPFEHVAKALGRGARNARSGNFRGWLQYRKTLAGEAVFPQNQRVLESLRGIPGIDL